MNAWRLLISLCVCVVCGWACVGDATDGSDATDASTPEVLTDVEDVANPGAPEVSSDVLEVEVMGPALCQGSETYCDRPFNQVAQVCNHNAMASDAYDFWVPTPNQVYDFTRQLDDGVRCLMLDSYEWKEDLYFCHSACGAGRVAMVEGLSEIATWLEANPTEVVTFILEAYISEAQFLAALAEAGLANADGSPGGLVYFHDAPPGTPWPTYGEMLEANQRLVVFTDDPQANGNWHLHWPSYGWETPFNDDTFTCDHGRGEPTAYDNQVFILNHYTLCIAGGCASNGEVNNAYETVLSRATSCWEKDDDMNPWAQIPTFINVDHYQVPTEGADPALPDVVEAAHALNALWTGGTSD